MSGEGHSMTKVQQAEHTLYGGISDVYPDVFFVGIGKQLSNEIVLIVYMDDATKLPVLPESWEGFRVVRRSLESLIS